MLTFIRISEFVSNDTATWLFLCFVCLCLFVSIRFIAIICAYWKFMYMFIILCTYQVLTGKMFQISTVWVKQLSWSSSFPAWFHSFQIQRWQSIILLQRQLVVSMLRYVYIEIINIAHKNASFVLPPMDQYRGHPRAF